MRIAINGQRLVQKEPAGPEIYTLNIILGLAKVDNQNQYTILMPYEPPKDIKKSLYALPSNFVVKILPPKISWTQISLAWELWRQKYDLLFSALHTLPILGLPRVKAVSMIHGLEYKTNQEKLTFPKNLFPGLPEKLTCRFSQELVTPSEHVKEAILANMKIKDAKHIWVIPEGVNYQIEKLVDQDLDILPVLKKYGIPPNPYLIFISTIQPRKNLRSIVEALSILVRQNKDFPLNLVVCGKLGWNYQDEILSPKKYGVEDRVFFTGRVPDSDLAGLLTHAFAFVSASFDEGFGLPVLEAMYCKVPLIISDIPAHRDLAKDLAFYFDPYSPQDLAQKILLLMGEEKKQKMTRLEEEKNLAQKYSWEKSAQSLLEVFEVATLKNKLSTPKS